MHEIQVQEVIQQIQAGDQGVFQGIFCKILGVFQGMFDYVFEKHIYPI